MAKLHEVLAVAADLKTTAGKLNEEAIAVFSKKPELFLGLTTSVRHFDEKDRGQDTTEHKAMSTTVIEKLSYLVRPNVRAIDGYLQTEATNQKAKADIVIDDKVIATDVPATVLLGLETKLADLRKVYAATPTLAQGTVWDEAVTESRGVYQARHDETRFRTRKTVRPIILAPATEHHPAQVQAITEDVPIAKITEQRMSGMMTSAQKSELLERLDRLLRAVKRARMRANNQDVENRRIGEDLFRYIHGDIVP